MRKILLSAVLPAVVAMQAYATEWSETVWFDTKISEYGNILESGWPSDGSLVTVAGQGAWTNTEFVTLSAEVDSARTNLVVSSPEGVGPFFMAARQQSNIADGSSVTVSAKAVFPAGEWLPEIEPGVKGSLSVLFDKTNGTTNYYGVVKGAGDGNEWVMLAGAAPTPDEEVCVSISLRKDGGKYYVSYSVGESILTHNEATEFEISIPEGKEAIEGACLTGSGEVSALWADVREIVLEPVFLTIPEMSNVMVTSVKIAGVDVLPDESGVYRVPAGSVVSVTFAPATGWVIDVNSMTFVVYDTMTLPEKGRPTPVDAASTIVINEVMASNGDSLASKNGGAELDWVELRNDGDDDVNLAGWYMYDSAAKPNKWVQLEGDCVVPARGYKIVWCNDSYTNWAEGEAHAKFGVGKKGGTVVLAWSNSVDSIVSTMELPPQMKDVSYGRGRREKTVLDKLAPAQWRVGSGEWQAASGPVGMPGATMAGFKVSSYQLNKDACANIPAVEAALASGKYSPTRTLTGVQTIAYKNSSGTGSTEFNSAYQSVTELGLSGSGTYYAILIEGVINIPRAGSWTFSVGSDDGFSLEAWNEKYCFQSEYTGGRSYGQTPAIFRVQEPGAYNVRLLYFQGTGGASLDFCVKEGEFKDYENFTLDGFNLVGTAASGIIHAGEWAGHILTDVSGLMLGISDTLEWKSSFMLDEVPLDGDNYRMKVRYADGFVAKVNDVTVWNATVSGARSLEDALTPVVFSIPSEILKIGENKVEITAINNDVSDAEFLISAEITVTKAAEENVFFREPTPCAANTAAGYGPASPKVSFSVPHGYKTEAFDLELSWTGENKVVYTSGIYYTLDGTSPTTSSLPYTGPIHISGTTCVRAAVPQEGSVIQQDASATYLFLDDILQQKRGDVPVGFPSTTINSQAMLYGMNQSVVNGADRDRLLRGFTNSVSTISLVIDPHNLFDPVEGIYVNAKACDGREWERTTMVEQIDPTNDANGFSTAGGIRIRGAFSRDPKYPKHSLRLFFRNDYGDGPLEFPLFGDEGASKFKKVDLRTSQNYAWANGFDPDTFIHEVFSRDTQRDMGDLYTRSRYYNLFINGHYWGLYQTQERGDEDFAETYNGGKSDNYDVIKTSQPGYVTGASEGTIDAWEALWNMAVNEGFSGAYSNNYRKAMGLNPDGTRNLEYPVYLNPLNLMDYIINFHYVVDSDSPASRSHFANNLYAVRDRNDSDEELKSQGFFFLRHDAEHSMGENTSYAKYSDNPTGYGTTAQNSKFANLENFNPAELHWKLCENAEYRMAFADRFYKHCLREGGALTVPEATKRFTSRMTEIDDVIVCEAARWATKGQTRQTWLNACGNCLNFVTNRMPYMLSQYRTRGWYPSIDPSVALNGAGATLSDGMTVAADDSLYLSGDGTVYYTLDGSDPRAEGGAVAAGAIEYSGAAPAPVDMPVIAKGDTWKYSDAGAKPGDNWTAADYDDSGWSTGAGRLGFASSGAFRTALNRYVGGGSSGTQVTTYYFRKIFTMPAGAGLMTELKASLDCDDGYVAYINGVEVKRDQVASTDYSAFSTATNMGEKEDTFVFPAGTLVEGENVIAVEVHQCNATSTDVWWDLALSYAKAGSVEGGIAVPAEGLSLTMRVLSQGGEWSALETVKVKGEEVLASQAEAVRIAAVYSSTLNGGDDGEFIVLTNITGNAVLLDGLRIISRKHGKEVSLTLTLPEMRIEAGSSVVLDQATYWPDPDKNIKITNGEVDMQLLDSEGDTIQTVFFSSKWWNRIADGTGIWLVAKEFGTVVTEESQWKPSESWVEKNLRFFEFDGVPADGNGGDTGEYFVLTNLSDTVTLNLSNVVVNICKSGDAESSSKCIVTIPAMTTLAPGATIRFDQATYWNGSKQKITNGALVMKIYDAEGATVQVSTPDQNDPAFAKYRAKFSSTDGGPVLRATSFARETTTADWMEYTPPAPQDWPANPDTEITETTKPTDLGITAGAFTNAVPAELIKLAKWAKEKSVPFGGEAVNAMSFDAEGNPATVFEEAYLLNCAVDEVEEKKAEFNFDSIVPGEVPQIPDEDDYNGVIHYLGATTLENGGNWSEENLGSARFFKAELRFR